VPIGLLNFAPSTGENPRAGGSRGTWTASASVVAVTQRLIVRTNMSVSYLITKLVA
jgi:hypothetical protein